MRNDPYDKIKKKICLTQNRQKPCETLRAHRYDTTFLESMRLQWMRVFNVFMHMFNVLIVLQCFLHFDNVSKLLLIVVIVFTAVFYVIADLDNILLRSNCMKNKMKPTNPNADTYVEEQRQHLCLTFSSEPTCETPWVDTLRWHSCRTPLLDTIAQRFLFDALAWHSCLTLLYDTLTWHCLLDTLVRHSYLTRFLDTCVGHSYLTLL